MEDENEQKRVKSAIIKKDISKLTCQVDTYKKLLSDVLRRQTSQTNSISDIQQKLSQSLTKEEEVRDMINKTKLRIQMLTDSCEMSQKSLDSVREDIQHEVNLHADLVAKRVSLEMEIRQNAMNWHNLSDKKQGLTRTTADLSRQLQRLKGVSVADEIAQYEYEAKQLSSEKIPKCEVKIKSAKSLICKLQGEISDIVEATVNEYNKEEVFTSKYKELTNSCQNITSETELLLKKKMKLCHALLHEEVKKDKFIKENQRVINETEKVKESVVMAGYSVERAKRTLQEVQKRCKEYFISYEIVKHERNKYITNISKSNSMISEIRYKLGTLTNELCILKSDYDAKIKAKTDAENLNKNSQKSLNNLKLEMCNVNNSGSKLNSNLERNILQLDSLNSLLLSLNSSYVKTKEDFDQHLSHRNLIGIRLVNSNDELCILYEKFNQLEKIFLDGQKELDTLDSEIRINNLRLSQIDSKLSGVKLPEVKQILSDILNAKDELCSLNGRLKEMECEQLAELNTLGQGEKSHFNFRKIPAQNKEFLNNELMNCRINYLKEMSVVVIDSIQTKQVVLEEIESLINSYQSALSSNSSTYSSFCEASRQLSLYRLSDQDLSDKLKGVVAEISMYKANIINMTEEIKKIKTELTNASEYNFLKMSSLEEFPENVLIEDLVPFEDLTNDVINRRIHLLKSSMRDGSGITMKEPAPKRPEPRVTAYIPSDDIGLPKAYGKHAPFKPTEPGSNMRHYIKPKIK